MTEGIALFCACLVLVYDWKVWVQGWARAEAVKDEAYKQGYEDAEMLNISLLQDESRQKVNRYMQSAIISQIENNGDYRWGDKSHITRCKTLQELEVEVHGIIER